MKHDYLMTELGHKYLRGLPWLAARLGFYRGGEYSDREIVRLLENRHCPRIRSLVDQINACGDSMGEIAQRLVSSRDTIEFSRAVSEFELFVHLQMHCGGRASVIPSSQVRTPDFSVQPDDPQTDNQLLIELYTPVDDFGCYTFERNLFNLIKNLRISLGFDVEVEILSKNTYYPHTFPCFRDVEAWLYKYRDVISNWIQTAEEGDVKITDTPWSDVSVKIMLNQLHESVHDRSIVFGPSTRSTDTIHYFRIDDPDTFISTQWGQKLIGKMCLRQAGDPRAGVLRILCVDFSLADTYDYSFLVDKSVVSRLHRYLRRMCERLPDPLPYDVVLPCAIDDQCGFGNPIFIADIDYHDSRRQLSSVGLSIPFPEIPIASEEETEKFMEDMLRLT